MTTSPQPDRVTAIYDALDAFQRQHRTVGGLQHAQIRALLAEHLDRALPSAPVTATVQPPADRTALRDRIAEVLADTALKPPFPHCRAMADAVLAVLPAPTDRAAAEAVQRALDVLRVWRDERQIGPEAARLLYEVGAALTDDSTELRRKADEAEAAEAADTKRSR